MLAFRKGPRISGPLRIVLLTLLFLIVEFLLRFLLPAEFKREIVLNRGLILSLLSGNFLVLGLAFLFAVVLLSMLFLIHSKSIRERWYVLGVSLVLGGFLGNCLEKVFGGGVVDFLGPHLFLPYYPREWVFLLSLGDVFVLSGLAIFWLKTSFLG